ncbi:large subunit ribosomal protein L18e [Nematocida homosporus]|uniref:large subunit ribosomal protein L18e n=1 Tax=Nematocida homosporus TaxID=1912981 RepID=UPI00221F75A2|nr:large subunit ribosomal protein L18e [Nematocida homosporus]KAI5184374.1 large subunit ribosomal protein L18e [Nematocida homosporus]
MLGRPSKVRSGRKAPTSHNDELQSLFKLFSTVAKRTTHAEYQKIANFLKKPRVHRSIVNLKKLVEYTAPCQDKIAVVVAKIVGEDSIVAVPHPIKVACLDISRAAKARIEKYGGQVFKLDELFSVAPTPDQFVIFQGPLKARKAYQYFGVPGDRHRPARPRVISKGSEKRKKRAVQK